MKIRIFALAKELGFDSKDLIQHCTDAGLNVKNSPLASITPAEQDVLMDHLKSLKTGSAPSLVSNAPIDLHKPIRERSGQDREIRDLGPLSNKLTARRPPRKQKAQEDSEEDDLDTTDVFDEPEMIEIEEEPVTSPEVWVEDTPASVVELVTETIAEKTETEIETPEKTELGNQAPPAQTPVLIQPEPVKRGPLPMSREDYVAPTGHSGSTIREMKPVSSVGAGRRTRKDKKKTPALPSLAATPNFKPKVVKKPDEGPVLKPDLALTGDVLKSSNKLKKLIDKSHETGPVSRRSSSGKVEPEKDDSMKGLSLEHARQQRRSRRQQTVEEEPARGRAGRSFNKRPRRSSGPIERKTEANVVSPMTVRSLSEAMGRPVKDLITILFKQGTMVTINDTIEDDAALEIALELGVDLHINYAEDFEDILFDRIERKDDDFGVDLVPRPPIITVLGHVDHGKTTLVDKIRSANVVAGEAGGITQHIAAYQVEHSGKKITFVDTPGHAAFGEMRARGANLTDIIVLVVAADDGVMPQTVECIAHAKAAGCPIVVAMNKCDLPDINEQRILTELSQHGVLPSEWGGDVEVVRVSALTGAGVEDLLETILLSAELNEYKTADNIPAEGVCLEGFRDEGRGPLAWGIIHRGTLRVGDVILCGAASGRVRVMYNDKDEEITEAGPSTPVRIAGFNEVPGAGERFFVMKDVEDAREMAEERRVRGRTEVLRGRGGPKTLERFFSEGEINKLPLIIKGDAPGSIEAIKGELNKFDHAEVQIDILHDGVGGVNESDVYLASSSGAIIIAFHVIAEDRAEHLASQEGVEIRRYNIIYNLIDDIGKALEGLLVPEKVEVPTGRALVLRTFSISRTGTIAGCRVLNGSIERSNRVHVIRDQTILNSYGIASLKREKDDAKEVREGYECGIRLDGFNDVKEGDLLEAYRIEERKRTLDE